MGSSVELSDPVRELQPEPPPLSEHRQPGLSGQRVAGEADPPIEEVLADDWFTQAERHWGWEPLSRYDAEFRDFMQRLRPQAEDGTP